MDSVIRQRSLGVVVLIAIGVGLPFALSQCFGGSAADNGSETRAVSIDTPGDESEQIAGNDNGPSNKQSRISNNANQSSGVDSSSNRGRVAANSDASNETTFETPSVSGSAGGSKTARADASTSATSAPTRAKRAEAPTAEGGAQSAEAKTRHAANSAANPATGASGQRQQPNAPAGGSGDWLVQVASFRDKSNATALVAKLKSRYASAYTTGKVDGKTYYRVHAGPFKSKNAAEKVAKALTQNGGKPYVHHR